MKGGKWKMNKKHLLMLLVLLFSFIAETMPALVTAHAETTKAEVINEKFLQVSYEYESQKESTRWRIKFNRHSEDNDKKQRLKLKVTNEKGKVISYPSTKDMIEKDEWLIEKNYSCSMEGQIIVELPKSIQKLYLDIQMDEQTLSEKQGTIVEANILEQQKTYVLEIDKKENSANNEEKIFNNNTDIKTNSSKFSKSQFENKNSISVKDSSALGKVGRLSYKNKVPEYTDESNGSRYPEYAWTPTGQSNVKNHQGGYENDDGWDGVTEWDVNSANNQTNSYIYYGSDKEMANIAIRKYASETKKDDEFNIRLNVRGSTVSKPGVDVCFVLDNSGSMRAESGKIDGRLRKDIVVSSLKNLISELKSVNTDAGVIRVGSVVYSTPGTYPYNKNPTVPLSGNKNDWDTIRTLYSDTRANGDTYTQQALIQAQTMLKNASGNNRRKVIFLLTDGAPNYSAKSISAESNSDIYYDGLHITENDENSIALGDPLQSKVSDPVEGPVFPTKIKSGWKLSQTGQTIYSHLTPVNSTAVDIKSEGTEINAIAINIKKDYQVEGHSTDELIRGLYRVASKKFETPGDKPNDYQFYHATTSGQIDTSIDEWFDSIVETISKGEVEDPIGDMFELVEWPKVTEVKKSGVDPIEVSGFPSIDNSDPRKIKVNNINLYGNQEIQIDYTVRLKTNDPNYKGGIWYSTNKTTTLTPESERSDATLEFGSPSAKGKVDKYEIPVEKIWSDTQKNTSDYWKLRSNSVEVELQRKNNSSWEKVETKSLSSMTSWRDTFTAIEGGKNIYRVVEKTQTTGYGKPVYNYSDEFTIATLPGDGIKLTNNLMLGETSFYKYKNDGKTTFVSDLPKFSVKRKSDGKVLATDMKPNADGLVTISDVPVGEFIIEETYVPVGYVKMTNIELKAVEDTSGTALVMTMNGQTPPLKVKNKLGDFRLIVNKKDQDGNSLTGATFRLEGINHDETKSGGSYFVFDMLEPGEYILTETIVPEGYHGMGSPVRISISQDGEVEIQDHQNVIGHGGIGKDKNEITVTVNNAKIRSGQLPETGSSGVMRVFKVAFGLIGAASGLTGGLYWFHMKRRGS